MASMSMAARPTTSAAATLPSSGAAPAAGWSKSRRSQSQSQTHRQSSAQQQQSSSHCRSGSDHSINGGSRSVAVHRQQYHHHHSVNQQQHHPDNHKTQNNSNTSTADGCCLARMFLQNLMSFATRSRRKAEGKENLGKFPGNVGKARGTSVTGNGRQHKSASAEFSICDSMDDEVLRRLTAMPRGVCPNEWIASQTLALFHHVNALHGAITEYCTPDSCPVMSCPGFPHLPWVDEKGKKWKYSAPQYIDCVLSFCEKNNCSEDLYPTKYGSQFSPLFDAHVRRSARLMWHVCGHLYLAHWDQVVALGLRPQAGAIFAHLKIFTELFALLDHKDAAALAQAVSVVRPPVQLVQSSSSSGRGAEYTGEQQQQQQHQGEPMDTSDSPPRQHYSINNNNNNNTMGGPLPHQQQQQWQCASAKSGSWGGVSTATGVEFTCKPCAQTC